MIITDIKHLGRMAAWLMDYPEARRVNPSHYDDNDAALTRFYQQRLSNQPNFPSKLSYECKDLLDGMLEPVRFEGRSAKPTSEQ